MALKEFRPLTPSLRFTQLHDFSELTPDSAPERSLMEIKRRTGGAQCPRQDYLASSGWWPQKTVSYY